jgi:GxxExxY protein
MRGTQMKRREEDAGIAEIAGRRIRELPAETNQVTGEVVAAACAVHTILGPGLLEGLYEQAMDVELRLRNIRFARQVRVPTYYKDEQIGESRLDLLVENHVVVELKSVAQLTPLHWQQLHSYLRVGGFEIGLLINFNVLRLRDGIRRIVSTF